MDRADRDGAPDRAPQIRGLDEQRRAHAGVEIVKDQRQRGADQDQEHAEAAQEPPGEPDTA